MLIQYREIFALSIANVVKTTHKLIFNIFYTSTSCWDFM